MTVITEKPPIVDPKDLELKVKQMYKDVAEHPKKDYHFEMGRGLAQRLGYNSDRLDQVPKEAIDSFAGVGCYFDLAKIQEGENILDLGSGSGMDVFYAGKLTGITGEVIGIDMTDAQLQKADRLKADMEDVNITFSKGYIEELPIVSNSIDVVISNGLTHCCLS